MGSERVELSDNRWVELRPQTIGTRKALSLALDKYPEASDTSRGYIAVTVTLAHCITAWSYDEPISEEAVDRLLTEEDCSALMPHLNEAPDPNSSGGSSAPAKAKASRRGNG